MHDKDIKLFIEMDADMSHHPNELLRNIDFFKKKNLDLLISSRYKKKSKIINWPINRKILSYLSNKFMRKTKISKYDLSKMIY